jgi:hypothetical protein
VTDDIEVKGILESPKFRPHAFAVTFGDGGPLIYYGQLLWNVEDTTTGIIEIKSVVPDVDGDPMLPELYKPLQLDGYGEVWLYWEYKMSSKEVQNCKVLPEEPDNDNPAPDIVKYKVKIAEINEGDEIKQFVSSDIFWYPVSQGSGPCIFGALEAIDDKTYITGGCIYSDDFAIDLQFPTTDLEIEEIPSQCYFFKIVWVSAQEDGILLPYSTEIPEVTFENAPYDDLPELKPPTLEDTSAIGIIPLGYWRVPPKDPDDPDDPDPIWTPTSCGHIHVHMGVHGLYWVRT